MFFGLSFLLTNCYTVDSVVQPSASDGLSILVSQSSITMLHIVDPLTFIFDSVSSQKETITMPYVLMPVTSVVRAILPFAGTDLFTHSFLIKFASVVTSVVSAKAFSGLLILWR